MSESVKGLSDSEDITIDGESDISTKGNNSKDGNNTDLMKMSGNLLTNINYKVAFLLFIVGMIIFSDVFIESVIGKFSDSVDGDSPTTKGTIIQLLLIVLAYIILDLIVKYEVL